jgi:SAM-dependent methyltransferase
VFAVSSRLCLTAFHCVGDRKTGRLRSKLIRCEWPGRILSNAAFYDGEPQSDVALIRLKKELPSELHPVLLLRESEEDKGFTSRGYPAGVPHDSPFAISGEITWMDSEYENIRAMQLRSNESIADFSLRGMSGSPVLVGKPQRAVGVIRSSYPRRNKPDLAMGGAAYAVPASVILDRWPEVASGRPADVANVRNILGNIALRARRRSATDIRAGIWHLLLVGGLGLDQNDLDAELEITSHGHCSIGVERGRALIEICPDIRSKPAASIAESRIDRYIKAQIQDTGLRYLGIVTDGAEWRVYHRVDGTLRQAPSVLSIDPARPKAEELLSWLEAIFSTSYDIKPTPAAIRSKLGATSPSYAVDSAELKTIYAQCRDMPDVKVKREMWAKLLTTAAGASFPDDDGLFVNHTLLVAIAEVIGHAMIDVDPEDPELTAKEIVSGTKFSELGISGVVEPDFFDWIAEVPDGTRFIKDLARRLSRFAWDEVEHDVMKPLYQSIIPPDVRRKLGEYYTPDWLAESIVERCVGDPLSQHVLDASCGSGTFLFYAIKRFLKAAEAEEEEREGQGSTVIEELTKHVSGFDVQPVAVTLARVTYLLAIGVERLQERPKFGVPVYLCDSLRWGQQEHIWSYKGLSVRTTLEHEDLLYDPEFTPDTNFDERLKFPDSVLADAGRFDQLVRELADRAVDTDRRRRSLRTAFEGITLSEGDRAIIERTFKNMCDLHDDGRDHIWGYYVRNLARPVWLARPDNRVDVLVGNPPWLSYRLMTGVQKKSFRDMIRARNLQTGAATATSQDLAALFVARCVELYLKPGGRFGYVMPRGTLALKQYERFRLANFSVPTEEVTVSFDTPWDLRAIKPPFFRQPASVVFGCRTPTGRTARGIGRTVEEWSGSFKTETAGLAEAEPKITRQEREIKPIGPGSPYREHFYQGAAVVPQVLFLVEPDDRGRLGPGKDQRAVKSRRSANEHQPWKSQHPLRGIVEKNFVRKLYLGACILPFRTLSPREAVIPWDGGLVDDNRLGSFSGLEGWWLKAERVWEGNRSDEDLSLLRQLDYRGKLSQQFPIPLYRVVYPKSAMYCMAAIIDNSDFDDAVIDQQLYWGTAASLAEARYLTAILNSTPLIDAVQQVQPYGEHNPRDIARYVFDLPIPMFEPERAAHQELAHLAARAGRVAYSVELRPVRFESQRRQVREALNEDGVAADIDVIVDRLLW